jgi:hypothetical protein
MSMETIFLSSYVKFPSNTTAEKIYDFLVLVVEVHVNTGVIVNADISLVTELGRDFICRLARGYCMREGIDGFLDKLHKAYFGESLKAIETCFKLLFIKYEKIISDGAINDKKFVTGQTAMKLRDTEPESKIKK